MLSDLKTYELTFIIELITLVLAESVDFKDNIHIYIEFLQFIVRVKFYVKYQL